MNEFVLKGDVNDALAGDRNAALGLHAFSVRINKLDATTQVVQKTTDADGNSLEAHVAGGITNLEVTSVTDGTGEEILSNGAVTAASFELLTITVQALGKDGLPPANGSTVTPLSGTSGFVGVGTAVQTEATDDNGEVTFSFGVGDASSRLSFRGGTDSTTLLVRVADPDAPAADTGPTIVELSTEAVSTFYHWYSGDAYSSDIFENVAGLVAVWKYTGAMWVGYVSNPNAPDSTKTGFSLADGDTLWIVTSGAVSISLD